MVVHTPKPIRLFLVRHGQSEGNVDLAVYRSKSDSAIQLTHAGWFQALNCGTFFNSFFEKSSPQGQVALWHSSYMRARQTAQGIREGIVSRISQYREEDCLVEQKFGLTDGLEDSEWRSQFPDYARRQAVFHDSKARHFFGYPGGETRAEVSERCKIIFNNIHRAHEQGVSDFIIVTHGVTLRAFMKEWLRIRHEDMASESNPGNCDVRYINAMSDLGYIYKGGVEREPVQTIHQTDRDYFEADAYLPSFVSRPSRTIFPRSSVRLGNGDA